MEEEVASYKGVKIALRVTPVRDGSWFVDFTLIEHHSPETTETMYYGPHKYRTIDEGKQAALDSARGIIDTKYRDRDGNVDQ